MTFDRASHLAALSFAKPLFQHRVVHVVSADAEVTAFVGTYIKNHGARTVTQGDVKTLAAEAVEVFFCVLGDTDLSEDIWAAVTRARAPGGVLLLQSTGDAARWAQTLSRRFGSVERAEVVRGDAAWVGPPGAVTATVSIDDAATLGSVFICSERPQRLALGSVSLCPPAKGAARAPSLEQSLSGDIAASLDEDRLREVESRLQQTMDDLVQAQLIAAQALAERDTLKRKLDLQKSSPASPVAAAPNGDPALMAALRDELAAIENLVHRLAAH